MKRDMKLVEEILEYVENQDCAVERLKILNHVSEHRYAGDHLGMLLDGGFLRTTYMLGGFIHPAWGLPDPYRQEDESFLLTWKGYDLLDELRSMMSSMPYRVAQMIKNEQLNKRAEEETKAAQLARDAVREQAQGERT